MTGTEAVLAAAPRQFQWKRIARMLLDNIVWLILALCLLIFSLSITGFFSWSRGSSFGNESRVAPSTSSREKRLADVRAT